MKKLFDPLFITYGVTWCIIHLCRYLHQPIPVLNDHLTDLVAVPAMAHLSLHFIRRFIVCNANYTYPLGYLLFMAGYTAVVFEWIMPHFSSRYTGDWWDVAAYFGGSFFYYYFHGNPSFHLFKQPI
ncbi:hypothetical protein HGH93_00385 [Chitinophaga polysaccharea]|uniref:hypothetical protein n=1 Tax=Chitinophaga polysaccharea TaxID=1293035 RepID=UPI001455AA03|nr:hypothetical protein [Chitinophaga polysaccharea]NLR56537.1 hypothetical protein [Chitinophaga polysaccharea]